MKLLLNELSIGNYLNLRKIKIDEYISNEPKIIMIDSIYGDILDLNKFLVNGLPLEFYNPIYISGELLENFGFVYVEEFDEFCYTDGSTIHFSYDEENNWYFESIKIKYIHQLQNVFLLKNNNNLNFK